MIIVYQHPRAGNSLVVIWRHPEVWQVPSFRFQYKSCDCNKTINLKISVTKVNFMQHIRRIALLQIVNIVIVFTKTFWYNDSRQHMLSFPRLSLEIN